MDTGKWKGWTRTLLHFIEIGSSAKQIPQAVENKYLNGSIASCSAKCRRGLGTQDRRSGRNLPGRDVGKPDRLLPSGRAPCSASSLYIQVTCAFFENGGSFRQPSRPARTSYVAGRRRSISSIVLSIPYALSSISFSNSSSAQSRV